MRQTVRSRFSLVNSQVVPSWNQVPPLTVAAGEHLLLARDAALARGAYHVPGQTRIVEWRSGKLSNGGEQLHLLKPGDVDEAGMRHWIEVDRLDYSDGSHEKNFDDGIDPWPVEADGEGLALSRLAPLAFGNDPNAWTAALPTPGSAND